MWATRLHPLRMGPRPLYLLLLRLLATWQVAETQPVLIIESVKLTILPGQHVASGTNVTLQCDPKITSGAGMPLKHGYTFFRDSDPVYAEANNTNSSLSYVIPHARVANSGSYKCSVAVHGQYKESNPESLSVTGLQTPVLFLDKGTVTEGEEVTASCSAPKETGSFFFYFREGSKEVMRVSTSDSLAKARLKFSSPGNKSVTCHYVISLQPDLVTSSKSKPSHVYVQELSIRPHIEVMPSANVIEGDDLEIACRVDGTRHKPSDIRVYLSKDNVLKETGKDSIVYRTRVQASDSGLYECKLVMGGVVKAASRSVVVSELFSRPVLTMEPPEVFEKESFSLTCYSHNISQRIQRGQVKYSLYRNGGVLTSGVVDGKANASRNGNYSCDAVVNHTRKSSDVIVFKANGLQTPVLSLDKGTVTEGEEVTASCSAPEETGSFFFYFFEGSKEVMRVPTSDSLATARLKFSSPGNKSVTCHYVISLQPDLVTSSKSKPSHVYVQELSIRPHIEVTPSANVFEGDYLEIACRVDGSHHKPSDITVFVSKDNVLKETGKDSIVYRTRVQASDSGLYECKLVMGGVLKAASRSVVVSALQQRPVL